MHMAHSHCAVVTVMKFKGSNEYNVVAAQMTDYPQYYWSANIHSNFDELTAL